MAKNTIKKDELTVEILKQHLYMGEDGKLYWGHETPKAKKDSMAGTVRPKDGYHSIVLLGTNYSAKQLEWFYKTGEWKTFPRVSKGTEDTDSKSIEKETVIGDTKAQKAEPVKAEPAKAEPVKAEPVKVEKLKPLTVTVYSDPSHGWAKVSKDLLKTLGIESEITPYSYQKESYAFLEEDQDLTTFILAARSKGYDVKLKEQHTDRDSKIRKYDSYSV